MHIQEVRITPIAIEDPPLLNAAGLHAPYALRTIIEIEDDHGVVGLSEIPGSEDITRALESASELLIKKSPFELNHILRQLTERFGKQEEDDRGQAPWDQRRLVHIFSAVEVACLDLIGKTIDKPVVDLLGGRCRDQVPFSAYLFFKYEGAGGPLNFSTDPSASGWNAARQNAALSPQGIVKQAEAMCKEFGFQSIKLKGGALPPQTEVNCILALQEAFGADTPLRLDPNAIWSVETAIEFGKKMEGVLEYYEDPTRGQENMAKVGKALSIPLATNMCTTSFDDLPSSIQLGSEDIILADHHYWGGLRASVDLGRICKTFDRGLSMHSNSHVGISLAAMTHLAAAVPNLTYAVDTHYPWQCCDEVVLGGRLKIEEGSLAVPEGAGLGVEIDRSALKRLHDNYTRCGLTQRNDELEMQKVEPGWRFQATRW